MSKAFKNLHMRLEPEDHDFIMKHADRTGISATKIIVKYIRYLRSLQYHKRKILDAKEE